MQTASSSGLAEGSTACHSSLDSFLDDILGAKTVVISDVHGSHYHCEDEDVLPLGWSRHFDRVCGETYYFNKDSGCTQWEHPQTSSPKLHLRTAISGKEFSVNLPDNCQVAHLQWDIDQYCLPDGWEQWHRNIDGNRGQVHYYHKDTDFWQLEHPLGDVSYRLVEEDRILLPSETVDANGADKPYVVVIIQVPTLLVGSKNKAAFAYTAEAAGYLSVAAGDEVEIMAAPEPGDRLFDKHFKYYYGCVGDYAGWFAWDIFE